MCENLLDVLANVVVTAKLKDWIPNVRFFVKGLRGLRRVHGLACRGSGHLKAILWETSEAKRRRDDDLFEP